MEHTARIMNEEIHKVKVIGRGSFGEVWEAVCRNTSVAVKIPLGRVTAQVIEDFQKEIEIMSQLRHRSICLYMGYCIPEPGKLVIVQELMSGGFDKVIHSRTKNTPLKQRLQLVLEACKGVAWLHHLPKPLFHRDLKPENILIDQDGHAKVCDFGLSHFDDNWEEEHPIGTPLYMAPEVMKGQTITDRVDIYSLGIILWETYTQQHPFSHHSSYPRYSNCVINGERPSIPATCPASLATLIKQCWDAVPENRPSISDLIARLEAVLAELDNINFSDSVINAIKQRDIAQFWIDNFMHQNEVPWAKFTELLFQFFETPLIQDPAEQQLAEDATDEQLAGASYSTLFNFSKLSQGSKERFAHEIRRRTALLALGSGSGDAAPERVGTFVLSPEVQSLYCLREAIRTSQKDVVGLVPFGAFCQRFGPITPANFLSVLQELRDLYSSERFYGEMSGGDAENIIKPKKVNCYIIRWTASRPDSFCMSYGILNERNTHNIVHFIFSRKKDEDGKGYFDHKGKHFPTLLSAVDEVASLFSLNAINTDRFAWLFIEPEVGTSSYQASGSSSSAL